MSEKTTILLVDDDVDFLLLQKVRLEKAGFNVVTAESVKDAERRFAEAQPALAVIDLMMEEMDAGFQLAYRLKKGARPIPVILVTAVTSETGRVFDADERSAAPWIYADKVLSKPVRFDQLEGEIRKLLVG